MLVGLIKDRDMEQEFKVQSYTRICWILQSLSDEHQLVDIDYPRLEVGARSMVVEVDSKKGVYYLDKLQSDGLHKMVANGNAFNVNASLRGVEIKISRAVLEEVVHDSSGDMYKIKIPSDLLYIQKRDSYRAKVRGVKRVSIQVMKPKADVDTTAAELPLKVRYQFLAMGDLIDISSGGCKVSFEGVEDESLMESGLEYHLAIYLPDQDEPLVATAVVMHCLFIKRMKVWQIGFSFKELDKDVNRGISTFVNHLQRLERQTAALFS